MSMSMKKADSPRTKYSSPMLRPPVTAKRWSATSSLLCMRRLMRSNSFSERSSRSRERTVARGQRVEPDAPRPPALPRQRVQQRSPDSCAYRSSTSSRTRTPRAAARRSAPMKARPLASAAMEICLRVEGLRSARSISASRRLPGLAAVGQQAEARQPGHIGRRRGGDDPRERGTGDVVIGEGGGARRWGRQAGAGGECGRGEGCGGAGEKPAGVVQQRNGEQRHAAIAAAGGCAAVAARRNPSCICNSAVHESSGGKTSARRWAFVGC